MEDRLSVGSRIETTIERVAFGGSGVGRIGGVVVFVPLTVDGDVVEAEIRRVQRNYLVAELTKILVPSPFRTNPPCRHYGICGGCHYQHMTYDHEMVLKEGQVRDAFERIGKFFDPPVKSIIPSPGMYRYRQKAEFHLFRDPGGFCLTGFMSFDGKSLVDIERCEIVDDSINEEYKNIKNNPSRLAQDKERMVFWSHLPYGTEGDITRRVGDREMIVPARGFFQANIFLVARLAALVGAACGHSEASRETLLDCCCGSGLFSLFAARRDQPIIGIDVDGESLRCAAQNMDRHGFSHAVFYRGSLEKMLRKLPSLATAPVGTAILDPPRTGSTERSIDSLAALNPADIVYVSCNPATLARDVRRFVDRGYLLRELQPLDMFPRTKHVEVVAVLSKPAGNG